MGQVRWRHGQAIADRELDVLCASDPEGKSALVFKAFELRGKGLARPSHRSGSRRCSERDRLKGALK
jgi:hypothetical protein